LSSELGPASPPSVLLPHRPFPLSVFFLGPLGCFGFCMPAKWPSTNSFSVSSNHPHQQCTNKYSFVLLTDSSSEVGRPPRHSCSPQPPFLYFAAKRARPPLLALDERCQSSLIDVGRRLLFLFFYTQVSLSSFFQTFRFTLPVFDLGCWRRV